MKWDKTIESWGFTWVNDCAERATMNFKGKEISIMAFGGNDFELAWIDKKGNIQERMVHRLKELKMAVEETKKILSK